jgi:transmembrane sensor
MHERAAFWVARLRSDSCTEGDLQEFALWLSASAEHQSAMDSMLELWDDLVVLEHMPADFEELRENSGTLADAAPTKRRQWLKFGLAAAACALFVSMLTPVFENGVQTDTYQTALGERQEVQLADGSTVTLNTDSKITVNLAGDLRHVVLNRGEVFFRVQRDTERAFVVEAGSAEVRVMGTAFNIHLKGDRSNITVTEGVVRVTETRNPANRAAVSELLYANQGIYSDSNGLAVAAAVDIASSTAWRDGKIVAQGMPLSELVQEIGRYHDLNILIAEPKLAQTLVSGVFPLENADAILAALEHSIGINAMELEDHSILLIKTSL